MFVVDYPSAEETKENEKVSLQYITLPLGIVIMKEYIITISLYKNPNIEDIVTCQIRGIHTAMRTRFLLKLLLRIFQRYLIYLRQINNLSLVTEHKLHKSMQNKELIQMLVLKKSLVYFLTSLKSMK